MVGDKSRSDTNAAPWSLVPADIDELEESEIPLLLKWCDESDIAGVLVTTYSHRPERPKYRMFLFTDRPVLASEHAFVHRALSRLVPFKLDPCMNKPSQPVYLPSCPPEHLNDAHSKVLTGSPLKVDVLLEGAREEMAEEQRRKAERIAGVSTGVRQPGGLIEYFNANFDLGAFLEKHKYKRKSRSRFVSPASHSGRAAVLLGEHGVVSFHDPEHDPLAVRNKSMQAVVLDAFAVFCKLEHADNFKAAFSAAAEQARSLGWEDSVASPPATRKEWPDDLEPEALYGLVGEIVREIEPHTESDPAAILIQVLVWFGAAVGRGSQFQGPYYPVEGDRHHCNLNCVLVGGTSKGRKGTSQGQVRRFYKDADNQLAQVSGLSSGEGLIYAVRDAVTRDEYDKKSKKTITIKVDSGVLDKRVAVTEPEFAQVLKQCGRAGNILSPVIRNCWDSGNLQSLTKNSPIKATGAHVSIIGHITVEELRRELNATESANGFANRFLFMMVKRSKTLPFGGQDIDPKILSDISGRLKASITRANKSVGAVGMTDAARVIWAAVYPTLSEGFPGLLGAVTARAEAQCIRLATIYAMLDNVSDIDAPHLRAALAVWKRCEASARYIFGSALGDPTADEILRALRAAGDAGLTRTSISYDLFKRHKSTAEIDAALQHLSNRNLAHSETISTGGRAAEVWKAGVR